MTIFLRSLRILSFLIMTLGVLNYCTQSGQGPTDTDAGLDTPSDSPEISLDQKEKNETEVGFEERDDGKTPPVDQIKATKISDNCLSSAAGDPLCYLVPTLIEGNIEQGQSPIHFMGLMKMKYNAEGKVAREEFYTSKNGDSPAKLTETGYGPDGLKSSETIIYDTNEDGNYEFKDTLRKVIKTQRQVQYFYQRDFPNTESLDLNHTEIYDGQGRLDGEFSVLSPEGANTPDERIEGFETFYDFDPQTKQLISIDTLFSKQSNTGLYQAQTRHILALQYADPSDDRLISSGMSVVLDCLFGIDCTGPIPITQEQKRIVSLLAFSVFNRNPNRNGRLDSIVTNLELTDMSDRTIQPDDPSRTKENKKFTCLFWYLNSDYQTKHLPRFLQNIFGDESLAPTTIACQEDGHSTWSVIRIGYEPLYKAAGLPPPQ